MRNGSVTKKVVFNYKSLETSALVGLISHFMGRCHAPIAVLLWKRQWFTSGLSSVSCEWQYVATYLVIVPGIFGLNRTVKRQTFDPAHLPQEGLGTRARRRAAE